jgi:hypothetical protein
VELVPLTVEQVWEQWGWLRNGLAECAARTNAHWLPEDTYVRLRGGTAWAYLLEDIGFVVLTQEWDPDGLVLFIWAMWCEPGSAIGKRREILDALEGLARKARAKRLRMQSPRQGWEWVEFFDPVATVYEHEVTI